MARLGGPSGRPRPYHRDGTPPPVSNPRSRQAAKLLRPSGHLDMAMSRGSCPRSGRPVASNARPPERLDGKHKLVEPCAQVRTCASAPRLGGRARRGFGPPEESPGSLGAAAGAAGVDSLALLPLLPLPPPLPPLLPLLPLLPLQPLPPLPPLLLVLPLPLLTSLRLLQHSEWSWSLVSYRNNEGI